MNKRRAFSFFLALCIVFSLLSMQALAAGQTENAQWEDTLWYAPETEASVRGVYEDDTGVLFYKGVAALQKIPAGSMLTGDEKVVYDAMVPVIRQIARGERASASITVGKNVVGSPTQVHAEFSGGDLSIDQIRRILDALLADLPYDLFWYDKVSGSGVHRIGENGKLYQVTFMFTVAANYRGGDEFTVDTTKTAAAKTAAANAKAIVDKYANVSDYEKLLGYKNEICSMVSYDYTAANSGSFTTNIDPWQLVSVFDGNPETNVVCEGYSKAFMYLCEMSSFIGDVSCYTVMGWLGSVRHMWNIVDMGGKRYLADVTNSDSGTTGMGGSLFMVGASGSVNGGYRASGLLYSYDDETKTLWGTGDTSILRLESTKYDPAANCTHMGSTETRNAKTPNCRETGYSGDVYCNICGEMLKKGEDLPLGDHIWAADSCTEIKICTLCNSEGPAGHSYDNRVDGSCNLCGIHREETEKRTVMHMLRMYDPNSGEHFYTGSEEEKDNLVAAGWNYEGVGFTFSMTTGAPVYRLYDRHNTFEHLYTMDEDEKEMLIALGWELEGVAFNSAYDTEVPQFRLHNPNETRGAYHFTSSTEERDMLIAAGWEYQGIGFYSSWK